MQNGNTAVVDLSAEFKQDLKDDSDEFKRIYSVVNTLTEIKEIENVEIKIDGEEYVTKSRI